MRTHSLQYVACIRAKVGSALSAAAEAAAKSGIEGHCEADDIICPAI
jgi:hypothetical protein